MRGEAGRSAVPSAGGVDDAPSGERRGSGEIAAPIRRRTRRRSAPVRHTEAACMRPTPNRAGAGRVGSRTARVVEHQRRTEAALRDGRPLGPACPAHQVTGGQPDSAFATRCRDLRAPLRAITLCAQLMEDYSPVDAEAQRRSGGSVSAPDGRAHRRSAALPRRPRDAADITTQMVRGVVRRWARARIERSSSYCRAASGVPIGRHRGMDEPRQRAEVHGNRAIEVGGRTRTARQHFVESVGLAE
jgi:hypothetical protein